MARGSWASYTLIQAKVRLDLEWMMFGGSNLAFFDPAIGRLASFRRTVCAK